ncbi:glycosyl transferase [Deinococcus actinosclerus]|nr:glycosyl transferase [Deinococcus actinosclerus]
MKRVYIHDWLSGGNAGAEKVLSHMINVFQAPIFTTVYKFDDFKDVNISKMTVITSNLQKWPFITKLYRNLLPIMPYQVEQFDLREYETIISSSHAVAKGVLVNSDQLHISYVHSPMRYAWDLYHQYLDESGLKRGVKGLVAKIILHYIRLWDHSTSNRVDVFLANSKYVAKRIQRTYRRPAKVLYPPVEVQRFDHTQPREEFYLAMSRFVPYKKIDLIVETFNTLGYPLKVIGGGPDFNRIKTMAGSNVEILGKIDDRQVAELMARCKAFVFAADEDFGIVPVEAQAAGAPVIAYGKGGVLETVVPNVTGVFFGQQNVESLIRAIGIFEENIDMFDASTIRKHAESFAPARFERQFAAIVRVAEQAHVRGDDPETAVIQLELENL